jgi:hypothetical protein
MDPGTLERLGPIIARELATGSGRRLKPPGADEDPPVHTSASRLSKVARQALARSATGLPLSALANCGVSTSSAYNRASGPL